MKDCISRATFAGRMARRRVHGISPRWAAVSRDLSIITFGFVRANKEKLLPDFWAGGVLETPKTRLRKLSPDDLTKYNPVKQLPLRRILIVGIVIGYRACRLGKPVQFANLTALLGDTTSTRYIHFQLMARDRGVSGGQSVAVLVQKSVRAMIMEIDHGPLSQTHHSARRPRSSS